MDEFDIIDKYFRPLTKYRQEADNLEDDVATIAAQEGYKLVVSKDLMVEDIHFLKSDGAFNIASKLLRSNLSDLASAGAKPLYYMLGFSKSPTIDEKFISEFCRGLRETQNEYKIYLIGGDSVATSDKLFFSITIFGETKIDQNMSRKQAESGDLIFVSGYIGDAFLGLKALRNEIKCDSKKDYEYLVNRHLKPTPRVELGSALLEDYLSKTAIDISDGLLADLEHICKSSNLDAVIYKDSVPISPAAYNSIRGSLDFSLADLMSGGDDYELIFTIKPERREEVIRLARVINVPVVCIGYFKESKSYEHKIQILDDAGQEILMSKYGYKHY